MSQSRVIIENVSPVINSGQHFIKRIVGDTVSVSVHLFGDGHDIINGQIIFKHENDKKWTEVFLTPTQNDHWIGEFKVEHLGFYSYNICGWVDNALNWQHSIERKIEDGQYVNVELLDGVQYLENAWSKASADDKKLIKSFTDTLKKGGDLEKKDLSHYQEAVKLAISHGLKQIFYKYPAKNFEVTHEQDLKVWVDRKKAEFSTWYEFFPRSASQETGKHGTFKDCIALLPRIKNLGFDVLYFPPIHPIGKVNRKGKNNATKALKDDVGSPWGVMNHRQIHKELGTLADFKVLIKEANDMGIEIAMDYALQCTPDHAYVKQHPDWFKWRPDGTVQYAENPPKKYQDILPINFETEDWKNLWNELKSVMEFWIDQGVKIFRVDNPHTKPYRFWQWLIDEVHKKNKEILFLAEAFTRPKVMHQLAKIGFTQSYTYYTWRNSKAELIEYMNEISNTDEKEYFRPNFWPNTPDINPYPLQTGNENLYMIRFFMAATLSSNYGMYGPVYEYIKHEPVLGKEEYINSEKYEIYNWNWNHENRMTNLMRLVNRLRYENEALQTTFNFTNCPTSNDQIFAYFKSTAGNKLLMIVNMDPYRRQEANVRIPWEKLSSRNLLLQDLISGNSYFWSNEWNYVALDPNLPFHLFKITER